jgi:hypothetical protein
MPWGRTARMRRRSASLRGRSGASEVETTAPGQSSGRSADWECSLLQAKRAPTGRPKPVGAPASPLVALPKSARCRKSPRAATFRSFRPRAMGAIMRYGTSKVKEQVRVFARKLRGCASDGWHFTGDAVRGRIAPVGLYEARAQRAPGGPRPGEAPFVPDEPAQGGLVSWCAEPAQLRTTGGLCPGMTECGPSSLIRAH